MYRERRIPELFTWLQSTVLLINLLLYVLNKSKRSSTGVESLRSIDNRTGAGFRSY